jgi:hypothetical protein
MTRRFPLLVVALLIAVSVVAGCGDEDGDQGSKGAAETTQATSSEPPAGDEKSSKQAPGGATDEQADEGSSDDSDSADDAPAAGGSNAAPGVSLDQASKACEENAESAERLPKQAREQFEEICDKAAAGDEEGLRESVRDICRQMVESSVPKDSPQRDEALASCDRATE